MERNHKSCKTTTTKQNSTKCTKSSSALCARPGKNNEWMSFMPHCPSWDESTASVSLQKWPNSESLSCYLAVKHVSMCCAPYLKLITNPTLLLSHIEMIYTYKVYILLCVYCMSSNYVRMWLILYCFYLDIIREMMPWFLIVPSKVKSRIWISEFPLLYWAQNGLVNENNSWRQTSQSNI